MKKKILFIRKLMRAAILIYSVTIIGSQLLMAAVSRGQILDKEVNARIHPSSLYEAVKQLQQQTQVDFAFDENQLKLEGKKVPAFLFSHTTLSQVLDQLLSGSAVGYEATDQQTILLYKQQQQGLITGHITDQNKQPLSGASIRVSPSNHTYSANADGNFTIPLPAGDYTLDVSYVSYLSQRRQISVAEGSRLSFDIVLQPAQDSLDEVIVVGYGTQKKLNLTGSISQINGEKLQNRMTPNVILGLQGIVPNLNVSINTAGGEPGATPDFNVRGPGSLSGGSPFVLVDGVPQDLNTLNPNDIASLTVLKDASASAIYGVRAAFGVILVTTKTGSQGSKPKVSYSGNTAWNAPTHLPNPANSLEWANAINEANNNSGFANYFSDENMDRIRQYIEHPGSIPENVVSPTDPNAWAPGSGNANVNWFDEYYKPWAFNQTHNLNISGGGNAVTYFLSGGFYDQGSQFRYGDESFKRYNLTSNLSSQVTDWFNVGLRTRYTKRRIDMPHAYAGLGSYYHEIPRRWPNQPVRDGNGHFNFYGLQMMTSGGRDISDEDELLNSLTLEVEPVKNWKINADINVRQGFNQTTKYEKTAYSYLVDNTKLPVAYTYPNWYGNNSLRDFYNSNNVYTSYELTPGKHYFKALIGFQSEAYQSEGINGLRYDLVSENVPSLSTATGNISLDGPKGHWSTLGTFLRLNYNYDEKYLLEFTGRYDGTSRFAEGKRWGLFPSVSAGYNLARERFWAPLADEIPLLKLRASYGTLGNQDISSSYYPYLSSLGVNSNLPWIMGSERPLFITAPGLVSPDLTWESTSTLNVGLDAEALEHRLTFSFDWYKRETSDMFGPLESYPAVLGTTAPKRNNASMDTKGFELTAGWNDKVGAVNYSVQLVLADNSTTITQYRNLSNTLTDYYEGEKLGEIWGYVTKGIYQTDQEVQNGYDQSFLYSQWRPGDVAYEDLDGNGKINNGNNTVTNPGDRKVIGNNTPRYSGSVNLGLQWKGFDISMLWQGVAKRDIAIGGNFFWGFVGSTAQSTVFKEQLDYWRPDNTDAYYPKPYMSAEVGKNEQVQTRYLQNGAYLRLKNLQVGYTLPASFLGKTFLQNVRVYFTGENLFTFTGLSSVFDPEAIGGGWGDGKLYPLAKTLSLGLNIGF